MFDAHGSHPHPVSVLPETSGSSTRPSMARSLFEAPRPDRFGDRHPDGDAGVRVLRHIHASQPVPRQNSFPCCELASRGGYTYDQLGRVLRCGRPGRGRLIEHLRSLPTSLVVCVTVTPLGHVSHLGLLARVRATWMPHERRDRGTQRLGLRPHRRGLHSRPDTRGPDRGPSSQPRSTSRPARTRTSDPDGATAFTRRTLVGRRTRTSSPSSPTSAYYRSTDQRAYGCPNLPRSGLNQAGRPPYGHRPTKWRLPARGWCSSGARMFDSGPAPTRPVRHLWLATYRRGRADGGCNAGTCWYLRPLTRMDNVKIERSPIYISKLTTDQKVGVRVPSGAPRYKAVTCGNAGCGFDCLGADSPKS